MTTPLYELTVGCYTQVLESTVGFLEKGLAHCQSNGTEPKAIVASTLYEDMQNFYFQVASLNHHSGKTIEALSSGEFNPPMHAFNHEAQDGDYDALIAETQANVALMKTQTAEDINACAGKTIIFKLGSREMPFTAENFVLSFSLPNFYFHATTTYDMLRMQGVQIGKMDFLGAMKVGV